MFDMIPTSFNLHGHTITVEMSDELTDKEDARGLASYRLGKITIQRFNDKFYNRPDSQIEQTFYHELVHFILNEMGEKELQGNEKFVDIFSSLLHQAIVTMKFDCEECVK